MHFHHPTKVRLQTYWNMRCINKYDRIYIPVFYWNIAFQNRLLIDHELEYQQKKFLFHGILLQEEELIAKENLQNDDGK